ncbi:hypothetical protein [Stutzerimonas xanthomarina]|uniref:hypothetical protein n=1 Tax=Stutzerimonas xanthomarina TaxID=271420 RepID=UPI0012EBB3A6|nr:hypothetical protein [Stutzerimonas xanthomarina]MCP9338240.1 hypothetical protein [Stutzerimonas xanthomarina]
MEKCPAEHTDGKHADQPEDIIEGQYIGLAGNHLAQLRRALSLSQLGVALA